MIHAPRSGRCLCGACRFTATPEAMEAGICHCSICRKWGSGATMSVNCTKVSWNTDAPLRSYRSSDVAERFFCGNCGTNLYWHGLEDDPSEQSIGLMVFDAPEDFAVTRQIYIDQKPDSYALAGKMQTFTRADILAQQNGTQNGESA